MDYVLDATRLKIEQDEKWAEWITKMPELHFPEHWKVKIIPPSAGALVRFHVTYKDTWVSVYFDGFDRLGIMGEPYWEIYPASNGDVERFMAEDTEDLIWEIRLALNDLPLWFKILRYFSNLYTDFKEALKGRK